MEAGEEDKLDIDDVELSLLSSSSGVGREAGLEESCLGEPDGGGARCTGPRGGYMLVVGVQIKSYTFVIKQS